MLPESCRWRMRTAAIRGEGRARGPRAGTASNSPCPPGRAWTRRSLRSPRARNASLPVLLLRHGEEERVVVAGNSILLRVQMGALYPGRVERLVVVAAGYEIVTKARALAMASSQPGATWSSASHEEEGDPGCRGRAHVAGVGLAPAGPRRPPARARDAALYHSTIARSRRSSRCRPRSPPTRRASSGRKASSCSPERGLSVRQGITTLSLRGAWLIGRWIIAQRGRPDGGRECLQPPERQAVFRRRRLVSADAGPMSADVEAPSAEVVATPGEIALSPGTAGRRPQPARRRLRKSRRHRAEVEAMSGDIALSPWTTGHRP